MLGLIVAIILTLLAFIFKRSKLLTVLLFVLMWILFGWNYWNGDYDMYEKRYKESIFALLENTYETGYVLLNILFNSFQFSFQQFFITMSGISLLLVLRFVLKYSLYPALFAAIFLWIFLPLDYVLLRNFMAFSIVLQGICSLIDNVKYKYLKFTLFVLLASTIHSSSMFYFLILLVVGKDKKLVFQQILFAAVGITLFYATFGKLILHNFLDDFGDGRGDFYQTNLITFFSLFLAQLLCTNFIVYAFSKIETQQKTFVNSNFYLLFFNINLIFFFLIVLYYDFSIFVRIFRHISLINCILVTNILYHLNKHKSEDLIVPKLLINVFFVLYLFFFLAYFVFPFDYFTIFPMFENNLILS